jgi:hypothetical protein
MSTSNQSVRGTSTPVGSSTTTKIINLPLPTADTEVSHSLSANLKQIIIRLRDYADLKFSFVSTESGTKFITIPKGTTLVLSELNFTGTSIYFQSPKSSQIVEILELF